MPGEDSPVKVWFKRIDAGIEVHKLWDEEYRVQECYNYWRGDQLPDPEDGNGNRRAQINKIHPEVRNNIPSLYFYRPYARLSAAPEQVDDPGSEIETDTALLQDTANHLARDTSVGLRENTLLALKEAHWAFGTVEVGYTADFIDAPEAGRPPLKEKKDTKVAAPLPEEPDTVGAYAPPPAPPVMGMEAAPSMEMPAPMPSAPMPPPEPGMDQMGLSVDEDSDIESLEAEVARLQGQLKKEVFFVKHVPARQVVVSMSDKPCLYGNDWIGYWEDVPLEDVKRCKAYKNTKDLKAVTLTEAEAERTKTFQESTGAADQVTLYRIWDLRNNEKWVLAKGHDKELLRKKVKRCPLKILRFDIDPYHFYPRPLILSKLGPQDEYNQSREFIRLERIARVSRYTYDEDGISAAQIKKFESGEMGVLVPRKAGTTGDVISPVVQPATSDGAIQSLTLSDKEFADVGGVGGDSKIAQSKTATQAKIGEVKEQAQDSFDRQIVAEWLSSIVKELVTLAVENMSIDRFIAINIAPDSPFAPQLVQDMQQRFQRINAQVLGKAASGYNWDVTIDLENLSPVSEEEKFQKWMTALGLFANPPMARMFSVSPPLLKRTLDLLGMKSAADQQQIMQAMQAVVQMEQQLAMQSQNAAPGISPSAGGGEPGAPSPGGGPQPGGPAGPGASVPKPPAPPGA